MRRLLTVSLLLAACGGDDPVSYSAPVGINLKAKSGDVKSGVINNEKGITTEQSNPYGAFVNAARGALGGRDPVRITVTSITLALGGKSKNVLALEEVFAGEVEVLFLMDGTTKNSFKAGHVADPTGSGPVSMAIDFGPEQLNPADYDALLSGSFKVVIRGAAATGFDGKDADADLLTTFEFEAF